MRAKTSWISDETWKLVDEHASLRRDPNYDQSALRCLTRRISAGIKSDRMKCMEEAAEAIDKHLLDNNVQAAWSQMKALYKHTGDHPSVPSHADLH